MYIQILEMPLHVHVHVHTFIISHSPTRPHFDGDAVLAEGLCLDELVDTVHGAVSSHAVAQSQGGGDAHSVSTHHLIRRMGNT